VSFFPPAVAQGRQVGLEVGMFTDDDDEYVRIRSESQGPFLAVATASNILLRDASVIVGVWSDFSGTKLSGLPAGKANELRMWIASHLVDLRRDVDRADEYLFREGVRETLLEVNPYPATIGTSHGACYADAAREAGIYLYWRALQSIGLTDEAREWRMLKRLRSPSKPRILSNSDFSEALDRLLEADPRDHQFDLHLAQLHVSKECGRAERDNASQAPGSSNKRPRELEVERPVGLNHDRDSWLYAQWQTGRVSQRTLAAETKKREQWDEIATAAGVARALKKYAERHNLPLLRKRRSTLKPND
jgi:hypothetical protein